MRRNGITIVIGLLLAAMLAGCEDQTGAVTGQAESAKEAAKEAMSQAESVKEAAESLAAYGQGLYESYVSGGDCDFSALDAYFEKLDKTNAAIDDFILERNADLLEPGEIRLLAGGCIESEDFETLTEFQEIYSAIQYNYNKDDDGVLRQADKGDEVILFSFREKEDGSITITDAQFAEKAEKEAASLEEMCAELGGSYEDAAEMLAFNRAYDMQTLIDYMEENADVTGIEYEGVVRTREELDELKDQRLREIFPDDFVEE
ncbi:MAG: hypothetical protein IKE56_10520 [Lachnospiraceae bacterium]|nr:hypothetical protein [Lachnospiraceae bacterium]